MGNISIRTIGYNVEKFIKAVILTFIKKYKYLLAVIAVTGVYAGILSNRTIVISETWYTYYAQCINRGEMAYRDFDYLYTPLYLYFITLFTKIFGYKIIMLRYLGIFFFCMIGAIVFLIFRELFRETYACIAAITAVFFMQSEVVNLFYDYTRFMDVISCLTLLFLVKAIKTHSISYRKYYLYIFLLGIFNALFYLIKQNMGLLFAAYLLVFIGMFSLILRDSKHRIFKGIAIYLGGLAIPILLFYAVILFQGSFFSFMKLTGVDALAAKGGIVAILFGWLKNNVSAFRQASYFAALVLFFLLLVYSSKKYLCVLCRGGGGKYRNRITIYDNICNFIFCILIVTYVLFSMKYSYLSRIAIDCSYLSPYSIFLIDFSIFILVVLRVVYCYMKKRNISTRDLLYIAVLGAYLAISYGCGMSGGLAEGQATLGVAFIVGFLLHSVDIRFGEICKTIIILGCLWVTLQSAEKKMVYTYNWWGMDESDFWSSNNLSEKIELLDGIYVSEETLDAFETIYDVITNKTNENEPIYCFPHIPNFYSICNRIDPGVRAKVQWFDVVSDISLKEDMAIIQDNPPKVILIYETSEYAYRSHEKYFRNGEISGTRMMKNFLINFAQTHGYTFYGRISSTENNNFLLWYKENNDYSLCDDFDGQGSYENPYLIKDIEDLLLLRERVETGNDFAGIYFKQTSDLDLSEIPNWIPIGIFESGFYFRGVYDGNGHIISNVRCKGKGNNGLFGQLGGIVCNLGIVGGDISGNCVGVIASHSLDENAMIINCYTDSRVEGLYRAGGIADNFSSGFIYNCISLGETYAMEQAGGVSYNSGTVENVFALNDAVISGIVNSRGNMNVLYCTKDYMESDNLLDLLNKAVYEIEHCKDHYMESGQAYDEEIGKTYVDWMGKIDLIYWKHNGKHHYPILQQESSY